MNEAVEIAQDLGYIDIPDGLLIHPSQVRDFAPERVCVLISGTQGEPMSALSRAAVDNHKHAKIEKGDTVVLSSRIIPGNEKTIFRMIDHLYRREAQVVYEDGAGGPPVHVSGHASQEELRLLMNLVRPKYFVPIHGEYRQLKRHAELAASMHGAVGQVLMIESDNEPGTLATIAERLAKAGVNIEYAYLATSVRSNAGLMILRPSNIESARAVLREL